MCTPKARIKQQQVQSAPSSEPWEEPAPRGASAVHGPSVVAESTSQEGEGRPAVRGQNRQERPRGTDYQQHTSIGGSQFPPEWGRQVRSFVPLPWLELLLSPRKPPVCPGRRSGRCQTLHSGPRGSSRLSSHSAHAGSPQGTPVDHCISSLLCDSFRMHGSGPRPYMADPTTSPRPSVWKTTPAARACMPKI